MKKNRGNNGGAKNPDQGKGKVKAQVTERLFAMLSQGGGEGVNAYVYGDNGNGNGNGGNNGGGNGNGNGGNNGNGLGNDGGGSSSSSSSDSDNGNDKGRGRGKAGARGKNLDHKDKRGVGKGKGKGLERGKHKGWYKDELGKPISFEFELPAYLIEPRAEVSYAYDEMGNRIKMIADKEITEYRYNEAEQLIAAGDTEYEYYENGNLITQYTPDETTEYYYDSAGRLRDVEFDDETWLSYRYDGFGRKVSRSEEYRHPEDTENKLRTESANYLFDGDKVLKEYTGEGGPLAEYYTGNDQVIARKMFGFHGRKEPGRYGNLQTRGGLMYYHYDALGNVTDQTDHLGDNIAKYRFDAFGGMFAGVLAPYSFQGITGKEYDPKSGLMYYSSRWYNPQIGRFTQPDTFKGHITNPVSQHPYAYVGNNPINRIDQTGHDSDIPEWLDWDSDGQVDWGQDDSDTFDQDGDNVADWLQDDYSDEWEYNDGTGWDWVGGGSGSGGDWGYGDGDDGGYSGGGGSSYHEPTKAERKTAFTGVAGRPAASVGLPKPKNKRLPPSTQAVKNKATENILKSVFEKH